MWGMRISFGRPPRSIAHCSTDGVIVTEPTDHETLAVCREFSLEPFLTEDIRRTGEFCKAVGINRGLDQLVGDGWLLHLDADIALPFDLRQCLNKAGLDKSCIYGCNRLCVTGWQNWQTVKGQGLHSRVNGWLAETKREGAWVGGVPAGPDNGYAPIGFFQLWGGQQGQDWRLPKHRYPEQHGNAARTDVQFAWQWDRPKRISIPELLVFHLESIDARMGVNWKGRKSARFGPDEPKQIQDASRALGAKPLPPRPPVPPKPPVPVYPPWPPWPNWPEWPPWPPWPYCDGRSE